MMSFEEVKAWFEPFPSPTGVLYISMVCDEFSNGLRVFSFPSPIGVLYINKRKGDKQLWQSQVSVP